MEGTHYCWISDPVGKVNKIKIVDGTAVALMIDHNWYLLLGYEQEYYNEQIKNYFN